MSETDQSSDVAALTVQLLSAYLSNNTVSSDGLAELIRTTKAALSQDATQSEAQVEAETFTPAVSARKSLASPDFIVSLVDGKSYKTLKRHLAAHGLTPESYRARYNLPATYPMVAPTYAAHRRAVAQKIGLGSRRLGTVSPSNKEAQSSGKVDASAPKASSSAKATKAPAKTGGAQGESKATSKPAGAKRMARAPKKAAT